MINKSIRVQATGSVANVSCGFDCLGFSIKGPSDIIRIEEKKTAGLEIIVTGKKCNDIPLDPKKNTAGKALLSFLNEVSEEPKYKIHIEKGIPPGSGLGSSAASAVSSVFGINALLDYPLNDHELLVHAMEGESAASGSLHADNVAPALFGGIILVRSYNPLDTISLPVPKNLFCTAVLPDLAVKTNEARKILPENITLGSAVEQSSNLAGFIAGLYEEDYELIGKSMIDLFAEPHRSKLIPHYKKLKNSALESGAIGCGISGSGPSIFALSKSEEIAKNIGENFCNSYNKYGINSISYHSKINLDPPKILD